MLTRSVKNFSLVFLSITLLPLLLFAQGYKVKTIVLDAGHGGRKPGAAGAFSTEKAVALEVTLKLGKKLKEALPDVRIIYTRTTDVDVDFLKRAQIANSNKADLFISIHCNSMGNIKVQDGYTTLKNGKKVPKYRSVRNNVVRGVETFVAGSHRLNEQDAAIRENADIKLEKNYKEKYDGYDPNDPATFIILSLFKNAFRDKSLKLAKLIQSNYIADGRESRGVKEQGILILQRCGMPAVLSEIGFISHPEEEKYINSDKGQDEITDAIVKAVKTYKADLEGK
ncbi:N-acetylmuramoyl-L-alanine amidase [Pedobacter sp. SYP-B3415]|uniref:N-acetylmuramoyl-L-alanine amidase family protein n=1 Tax=Pedobacter sp. SYP-B3415 TaxID=2496641 RepID=UPI00101DFD25|nr:N-acetylmuramoyl-L-alanine amidase [Pedobacter sp. SYP-B3415]